MGSNYSEEEKQEFREKDKRINRVAILKSLIESGKVVVNEVSENCFLAEQYVEYIYNGLPCEKEIKEAKQEPKKEEIDWTDIAKKLSIPTLTIQNIKVLTAVISEYKKINSGAVIRPSELLDVVYRKFGKYPTSMSSVETILKTLT